MSLHCTVVWWTRPFFLGQIKPGIQGTWICWFHEVFELSSRPACSAGSTKARLGQFAVRVRAGARERDWNWGALHPTWSCGSAIFTVGLLLYTQEWKKKVQPTVQLIAVTLQKEVESSNNPDFKVLNTTSLFCQCYIPTTSLFASATPPVCLPVLSPLYSVGVYISTFHFFFWYITAIRY